MRQPVPLVIFALDAQRYALRLAAVDRIARAVEITPLPQAPDIVLGLINVQGQVIPVVNPRRRFRLPERDLDLSDRLIIARTSKRPVALVVDSVAGLIEVSGQEIVAAETLLGRADYVEGVLRLADGLVLIHDLDEFLSLDEERALERAMGGQA
jgi:purine-binding chemotaxis protein CheW